MKQTLIEAYADLERFYDASKKAYVFGDDYATIVFDDKKEMSWIGANIIAPNAEIVMLHENVTLARGAGIDARSLSAIKIRAEGDIKLSLCLSGKCIVSRKNIAAHRILARSIRAKSIFAGKIYTEELYAKNIRCVWLESDLIDCPNVVTNMKKD